MKISLSFKYYSLLVLLAIIAAVTCYIVSIRLKNNSSNLVNILIAGKQANETLANFYIQDDATKAMVISPEQIAEFSERKITSYDKNTEIFALMTKNLGTLTEALEILAKIEDIDTKEIRPLDTMILETLFEDQEKAKILYFEKYAPKQKTMENMIRQLIRVTETEVARQQTLLIEQNRSSMIEVILTLLIGLSGVGTAIVILTRKTSRQLKSDVAELNRGTAKIHIESDKLNQSANHVLSTCKSQNTALHQLHTSLDKISSSIKLLGNKSVDCRTHAQKTSQGISEGADVVTEMTTLMQDLTSAMATIRESNENLLELTTSRFEQITQFVQDIATETTSITDIVLQTKILAFNASVEASRAGSTEGKGFSVIADEVSNLASLSGKASDRISTILGESSRQIHDIVSTIEKTVTESKVSIDSGYEVTSESARKFQEVDQIFSKISNNINDINQKVETINLEFQRQNLEISQVGEKLEFLERASSTTEEAAAENQVICDSLNHLSSDLSQTRDGLSEAVFGNLPPDKKKTAA